MRKVLTIAGSDCSGGAGIQADLKTMTALRVYGMSVITALTAQNTQGVQGVCTTEADFTRMQLQSIFDDIVPDAVKIGMVSDENNIRVIAEMLKKYHAKNIVLDTVMVSTSGHSLIEETAKEALITELLPLADILTPNIAEAEILSGIVIRTKEDMVKAANEISRYTKGAVLIKGGHFTFCADDLLYEGGKTFFFEERHIENENTHGTGCTMSSAIACGLANDQGIYESVLYAKRYITGAIRDGLNLGKGRGPLNHMYAINCCKSKDNVL